MAADSTLAMNCLKKDRTQEHIIGQLSTDLLNILLAARDAKSHLIERHVSPRVVVSMDRVIGIAPEPGWTSYSRNEILARTRSQKLTDPGYSFHVCRDMVETEVYGEGYKGTAWVRGYFEGDEARLTREWIVRLQWRRRRVGNSADLVGDRWICERIEALTAAGGFIGVW